MTEGKTLRCVDCGAEFDFSAAEQERYAQMGFLHDPKRCPPCRETRRRPQPGEFHITICADCGREAQVPFLPRPGRPVYCGECYARLAGPRP